MRTLLLALLVVGLVAPALSARAENVSPPASTNLQLEIKRKRHVVRPTPPPAATEEDVNRAEAEARERAREDRVIRESVTAPPRRPDLSYDAVSGIQSRTQQKATGR
jgi:hypothetical protein